MWNPFKKKVQVNNKIEPDFADISHWEKCDFSKYEKAMIITKCTEGVSILDNTYKAVKDGAKKKGIKFGAYHFFRCDKPTIQQARFFLSNIGSDVDYIVLDIETLDGTQPTLVNQLIKPWLEYVEKETGKTPIIYSGHAFILAMKLDQSFTKYPLWLARYTNIRPEAPAPWKEWLWWQFSDKAAFKGIGECDGNVYNKNSNYTPN